jgi:hypothetical protein
MSNCVLANRVPGLPRNFFSPKPPRPYNPNVGCHTPVKSCQISSFRAVPAKNSRWERPQTAFRNINNGGDPPAIEPWKTRHINLPPSTALLANSVAKSQQNLRRLHPFAPSTKTLPPYRCLADTPQPINADISCRECCQTATYHLPGPLSFRPKGSGVGFARTIYHWKTTSPRNPLPTPLRCKALLV